jgi:hypothetical protein
VEISRFVAYAATFRSEADVDRYLARMGGPALEAIARQLLLPDATARKLIARAHTSRRPFEEFCRLVHRPDVIASVLERSGTYRERLRGYLVRSVGLAAGDRLLFVDLGYSGTAQNCLEPLFREEWGVEVSGCYLLLARTPGWERSRTGLIAPDLLDDNAINALVTNVAALEQICTAAQGSVVDYADDGTPVRKALDISPGQYARIVPVQEACQRFVAEAEGFFAATGKAPALDDVRVNAIGALGRLLFFPTRGEIEALCDFELDVNLNTDATVPIIQTDQAHRSLRRLGLAYTLIEERMNQPMELRKFGLDLVTTLLAQHRFRWDIALDDLSHERIQLPIMIARSGAVTTATVEARPTFDGYYSALVATGAGELDFALQFGRLYSWLQLESVVLMPVTELYRKQNVFSSSGTAEVDLTDSLVLEKTERLANGLLHCADEDSFVFVPARGRHAGSERLACRVVFRPIAPR